jgi:hypothetical protein
VTSQGNTSPSAPRAAGRGQPSTQIWIAWRTCSVRWATTTTTRAARAARCHGPLRLPRRLSSSEARPATARLVPATFCAIAHSPSRRVPAPPATAGSGDVGCKACSPGAAASRRAGNPAGTRRYRAIMSLLSEQLPALHPACVDRVMPDVPSLSVTGLPRRISQVRATARITRDRILNSRPRSGRVPASSVAPTVPASGTAHVGQPNVATATASEAVEPTGPGSAPGRAR